MSSTQREDGLLSHISVLNTYTAAPLTLAVPAGARVADLKTVIAEQCPGQPRPNGQRIIWKGRIVVDEEVVGDIWKASRFPSWAAISSLISARNNSLVRILTPCIWLYIPRLGRPHQPMKSPRIRLQYLPPLRLRCHIRCTLSEVWLTLPCSHPSTIQLPVLYRVQLVLQRS
jgi:hypothetical protein